ncbi:hypothetical protein PVK06_010959 [Gossypium arboreum]|uniref:Copia protein n=1 Tax=Gossypium arboreum TaxID=29729 RepID=A0ABR0Q7Q8_GOSAR|nr:hypothetical protein PVK06_010959 [Gossypium arboreum]
MASSNLQDNRLTTTPLSNSRSTSQPLSLSPLDPPPPPPSVPYNSHAMVTRSKAGIFKPKLIGEIGILISQPLVVWCDNTSRVSITANPTHHAKVKYVEIDHHFVREKVLDGMLQVNYVPSSKQIADVLTKPITPK